MLAASFRKMAPYISGDVRADRSDQESFRALGKEGGCSSCMWCGRAANFVRSARIMRILTCLAALTLAGCASWKPNWKQVQNPDGPLDLAMTLIGRAEPDVAPIEEVSDGGGAI